MRVRAVNAQATLFLFFTWFKTIELFEVEKHAKRNRILFRMGLINCLIKLSYWLGIDLICSYNHCDALFLTLFFFTNIRIWNVFEFFQIHYFSCSFGAFHEVVRGNWILDQKVIDCLMVNFASIFALVGWLNIDEIL